MSFLGLFLSGCSDDDGPVNPTDATVGSLYPVLRDGKWGYIDNTGTVVIDFQYERADVFDVAYDNGSHDNTRAAVRINRKYGYIDRKGNLVVQPQFEFAGGFFDGRAAVRLAGSPLYGFINTDGAMVIAPRYLEYRPFSEGVAAVKLADTTWIYIDIHGSRIINEEFTFAMDFREGVAPVGKNRRCGLIDRSGLEILPFTYDYMFSFHDGLAYAVQDGKAGYIRKDGSIAIPFAYDPDVRIRPRFRNGLGLVHSNGLAGFVDTTGTQVITPRYEYAYPFSEGRAAFNLGIAWGYLDTRGNIAIKQQFLDAGPFVHGLARVLLDEDNDTDFEVGYIDTEGNYIWLPEE